MRVISGSPRPTWRAAAASGVRSAPGLASRARLAAQYQAGVAVAFGLASDPAGQLGELAVRGVAWCGAFVVPLGFQESGDGGPVEGALAAGPAHEPVRLSVDLGRRGHDVTALGAEVEVVVGEAAVVLV